MLVGEQEEEDKEEDDDEKDLLERAGNDFVMVPDVILYICDTYYYCAIACWLTATANTYYYY